MSSGAAEPARSGPEWDRLELNVRRLLDAHESVRLKLQQAETRIQDLQAALADVSGGKLDPVALADKVRAYERENQELHQRLTQARETVERIRSRLQFLEEER